MQVRRTLSEISYPRPPDTPSPLPPRTLSETSSPVAPLNLDRSSSSSASSFSRSPGVRRSWWLGWWWAGGGKLLARGPTRLRGAGRAWRVVGSPPAAPRAHRSRPPRRVASGRRSPEKRMGKRMETEWFIWSTIACRQNGKEGGHEMVGWAWWAGVGGLGGLRGGWWNRLQSVGRPVNLVGQRLAVLLEPIHPVLQLPLRSAQLLLQLHRHPPAGGGGRVVAGWWKGGWVVVVVVCRRGMGPSRAVRNVRAVAGWVCWLGSQLQGAR